MKFSTWLAALTEKTTPADTDLLVLLDSAASNAPKKIQKSNLVAAGSGDGTPVDGWVDPSETWIYASASTFTVSGDQTAKYRKGTKLRWKQGAGYKYGNVLSSSYSDPNTTVTIIVNTDYTIANASITDNDYSYMDTPQGFPNYFNWSPTPSNFTVGSGTLVARYSVNSAYSMTFFVQFTMGSGSAMGSGPTFSLPISTAERCVFMNYMEDAGVAGYIGMCSVYNGNTCSVQLVNTASTYAVGANVTAFAPFSWGSGDFFALTGNIVW